MKKTAIPVNGEILHAHFGGAGAFKFYFIENNKVVKTQMAVPPAHEPGVIPKWVAEMEVTDIILGGIGQRAVSIFEHFNINVIKGAIEENADLIIEKYLAGSLVASGENCNHDHDHGHHDHGHHHS